MWPARLKAIEIILDRAWGTEGKIDLNVECGVGALRIEIVDPQAPETITVNPRPVANGHDKNTLHTDDNPIRVTFVGDEEN